MVDPAFVEAFFAERDSTPDDEAARAALERFAADAIARWPNVAVSPATFGAWLAARVPEGGAISETVADLHGADLYLALGCAHGDSAAIEGFARAFRPTLDAVFSGHRARGAASEDLRQQLIQHLLVPAGDQPPRIASYQGRGSLKSWVKVAALRMRIDRERRRDRERPGSDGLLDALSDPGHDPELQFLKVHYRGEFRTAFTAALADLTPKQRNLLRHTVVHGLSGTEVAGLYDVHRATAKRWIAAAREALLVGTRRRLMTKLGVGRGEFESIMRLIESNLEISVGVFVSAGAEEEA